MRLPASTDGTSDAAVPVHVLLLNWNGWRDTIECLESVLRLDWPSVRVVVCDNGSSDDSIDRLVAWADGTVAGPDPAHPQLRALVRPPVAKPIPYLRLTRAASESAEVAAASAPLTIIDVGSNLGFAGGNNVGLRYLARTGAEGYVWVLNNDTVVAPDALRALVGVAREHPDIGVVGSTLLDYQMPERVLEAGGGSLSRWHGWTVPRSATIDAVPLEFVKGASMLVSLGTVRRVGLMDERFFLYSEDVDWCLAMRARGLRLAHAEGSRVWHKEGASSGHRSPVHDYHSVKGALMLVHKHDRRRVPVALLYSAFRCALPKLLRGDWRRLQAVLRGWRDFVRDPRAKGAL